MRKPFILTILICLFIQKMNGQIKEEEQANYAQFIHQFTKDFNAGDFSHIANSASPSFLKSIPEKKLTAFLEGIRNGFGNIQITRFKYFDGKRSAVYHAELKEAWFDFIIGLDSSNKMQRLVVLPPNYNEDLPLVSNTTHLQLPFDEKDEWYVFWGGDTEDQNYHVTVRSQKNAFDFMIHDATNKSYRSNGKINEDYYCFGKNIYAPCDGVIVSQVDSVHDNIPGEMNPAQLAGNHVVIKSAKNEYILLAHFKINSLLVKNGARVKKGQLLGLAGNSGNSSEPHLHLHMMDKPGMKEGTGIKCFFDNLLVNGIRKKKYSPVRGERIKKF